jgi:hypothetical protein
MFIISINMIELRNLVTSIIINCIYNYLKKIQKY